MAPKALDHESINENVKKVQYAVRGELYLRASELQKEGKKVCMLIIRCSSVYFCFNFLYSASHDYQFPDHLYECWEPSRPWPEAFDLSSSGSIRLPSSFTLLSLNDSICISIPFCILLI